MIAIIPCAGRGTRRRPETSYMPKILLDYAGEPLIEHIVRPIDMSEQFDKIVLVLSLKHGQQVIDYIHHHPFETPVRFVWQNEPLGFGHAVLQAREEVFSFAKWNPLRSVSPRPVLIHTDDAVNTSLNPEKPAVSLVQEMTNSATSRVGVQWRGNVRDYDMVIVGENGKTGKRENEKAGHLPRPNSPSEKARSRGSESRSEDPDKSGGAGKKNSHTRHLVPTHTQPLVERLVEKPYWDEGGLAMTGIYFVRESRRLFRCLNRLVKAGRCLGGEYQFTHALQMMIDAGTPFQTHYHEWVDCGNARKREDEKVH